MAFGAMTKTEALSLYLQDAIHRVYLYFAGDGAYPAGGTADFEGLVQTFLGKTVTLVGWTPDVVRSGGYLYYWDPTNDKLKCFYCTNNGGAAGPLVEDTTANQSGRTVAGWVDYK